MGHPAANDQVCVVRHGFLLWSLRVMLTRVASSSPPALRSTARRINGAAPVHREVDTGDKIILHESQYRGGDVFGLPLAPHQRQTDRFLALGRASLPITLTGAHRASSRSSFGFSTSS